MDEGPRMLCTMLGLKKPIAIGSEATRSTGESAPTSSKDSRMAVFMRDMG
jgi:hypothetical protein